MGSLAVCRTGSATDDSGTTSGARSTSGSVTLFVFSVLTSAVVSVGAEAGG